MDDFCGTARLPKDGVFVSPYLVFVTICYLAVIEKLYLLFSGSAVKVAYSAFVLLCYVLPLSHYLAHQGAFLHVMLCQLLAIVFPI